MIIWLGGDGLGVGWDLSLERDVLILSRLHVPRSRPRVVEARTRLHDKVPNSVQIPVAARQSGLTSHIPRGWLVMNGLAANVIVLRCDQVLLELLWVQ